MRIFVLLLVSAFTRRWETFPPVSCHTICCVDTHLHVDVAVEVNTWTALHFLLTLRTQIDFNHFKSIAESVILVLIFPYKLSYFISLVVYRNSIYSVVADILITISYFHRIAISKLLTQLSVPLLVIEIVVWCSWHDLNYILIKYTIHRRANILYELLKPLSLIIVFV